MAIYVKKSTDAGAPALTQAAGSLITLLDFLLVTTMGWTKPFTGTNKAAYRMPLGTNRFYLRVDDSAANNARVLMYESMTDVDTGTNPFPTNAQLSGGLYLYKSNATATRPWKFYSNGSYCHLFVQYDGSNWVPTRWGDISSYKVGDTFGTDICAENTTTPNYNAAKVYRSVGDVASALGHYIARPYTQVGSSLLVVANSDWTRINGAASTFITMGLQGLAYPSPIEGGLHMAPLWLGEAGANYRGLIPGIWVPGHTRPLTDGDTFSGVGNLAGRTFEAVGIGTTAMAFLETSDTWGGV